MVKVNHTKQSGVYCSRKQKSIYASRTRRTTQHLYLVYESSCDPPLPFQNREPVHDKPPRSREKRGTRSPIPRRPPRHRASSPHRGIRAQEPHDEIQRQPEPAARTRRSPDRMDPPVAEPIEGNSLLRRRSSGVAQPPENPDPPAVSVVRVRRSPQSGWLPTEPNRRGCRLCYIHPTPCAAAARVFLPLSSWPEPDQGPSLRLCYTPVLVLEGEGGSTDRWVRSCFIYTSS